jgi:NAD(P)-dependent dehydrogenase (short-subunit alcohol dehydrogenase family)
LKFNIGYILKEKPILEDVFEVKSFEEIPDADWLRFFDVNEPSGIRLPRMHLSFMKQADWGRIIFISSESAIQIKAEMEHYGMTKTAANCRITGNSRNPGRYCHYR